MKMRLQDGNKQIVPVPINTILVCGSSAQIFAGDTRKGFVPADSACGV